MSSRLPPSVFLGILGLTTAILFYFVTPPPPPDPNPRPAQGTVTIYEDRSVEGMWVLRQGGHLVPVLPGMVDKPPFHSSQLQWRPFTDEERETYKQILREQRAATGL